MDDLDGSVRSLRLRGRACDKGPVSQTRTGEALDAETGPVHASELTSEELRALADPDVAAAVDKEAQILGEDSYAAHDPAFLLREALADTLDQQAKAAPTLPAPGDLNAADELLLQSAFGEWLGGFTFGMEAGATIHAQSGRRVPGPPVKERNASLIARDVDDTVVVSFIHWPALNHSRHSVVGREIAVDDGKFVFSVPAYFPLIKFKSKMHPDGIPYHVILADVGERTQQVKKPDRPLVPAVALRAQKMFQIAVARKSSETADALTVHPCLVCQNNCLPLLTCAVCLTTAHAECADRLSRWATENRALANAASPRTQFLKIFQGSLCPLCQGTALVHFESP